MASGAPSATWTSAAQWHVTLKFVARLPAGAVGLLSEALTEVAKGRVGPSAALRLGALPSIEEADVVVAELDDPNGDIERLAHAVERAARAIRLPGPTRPLRPHVTLARLKRPFDARKWLRPDLADKVGECCLASITLYKSHLLPAGSEYEALARAGFASVQAAG